MTALIDLAIRSSILLAFGLLLSACLARASAALRHRVLAGSLLAAVAVLPLSLALPRWTIALPVNVAGDASPAPAVAVRREATLSAVLTDATDVAAAVPAVTSALPLATLWLVGAAAAGLTLIVGLVRVGRIAARASRVDDRRWLEVLGSVAKTYGLTREVVVSRTDSPSLLATWGVLRPQVLVPRHSTDWTTDRIHIVLSHELAHIRRHDWLVQIAAEATRMVLWFNPLAWLVCARLRRESEQACDDEVLRGGVGGREYAVHLFELARQCRPAACTPVLPMAHPSTLERRIAAMLNPRLHRQAPSRRVLGALAVLFLLVTLPVALVRAGQGAPAPLSGTIYDVTGGVLPGVEVTLVDANGAKWTATSNASGRFALPAVGPGRYVLEAALAGFRPLRHEFELRDARDWERAITLQVGNLRETISVRETRVTPAKPQGAARPGVQSVRVGGNVRAPRKIRDVKPVYPASMREAGLAGEVPVEAIIGVDGTVSSVRVLSAHVHPDFAIAAVDAVRQWRFTPTLLNGEPVEVVINVSIRFDLD